LSSGRLVNAVASQIASSFAEARPAPAAAVAGLDATAIADLLAARLAEAPKALDPGATVASAVLRRLSALRVEGSVAESQDFARRLSSAVAESVKRQRYAEAAPAAEAAASGEGQEALSKGAAESATQARKPAA